MAKNIISNAPLENHPYIFLNETTGDHVFALTQFVTSLHGVELTKETKAAFNAFALEFINEHDLERVTFSNARGLIFVKFDIAAINDPDAYRLMVLFALMAGCKLFNVKLDRADNADLELDCIKFLLPTVLLNGGITYIHFCDMVTNIELNAPAIKGVSFYDAAISEYNPYKAPALPHNLQVLAINNLDNRLMINMHGFCAQVSRAVHSLVMSEHPENLGFVSSSTTSNLFKGFSSLSDMSKFYMNGDNDYGIERFNQFLELPIQDYYVDAYPWAFVYHSNAAAKVFAIEALKAAYFDASLKGFTPDQFLACSFKLVHRVASCIFNFKEGGARAFTNFCKSIILPFEYALYLERAHLKIERLEEELEQVS